MPVDALPPLYPLPLSLSRPAARAFPYPGLKQREIAREAPSWEHLRRMARTRWVRQHVGHPAAVTAQVRWGGSIRSSFHQVWTRLGVPSWRQAQYDCLVRNEGGYDTMQRWFGGAVGWDPGRVGSEDVVGPGQQRPYHASKVVKALVGRDRWVTRETFKALTNPYVHAKIMSMLGNSAYAAATRQECGL